MTDIKAILSDFEAVCPSAPPSDESSSSADESTFFSTLSNNVDMQSAVFAALNAEDAKDFSGFQSQVSNPGGGGGTSPRLSPKVPRIGSDKLGLVLKMLLRW